MVILKIASVYKLAFPLAVIPRLDRGIQSFQRRLDPPVNPEDDETGLDTQTLNKGVCFTYGFLYVKIMAESYIWATIADTVGEGCVGQTKNFFREKKSWSVVKDRILDYYLAPYTSKVLRTGKPIVFCDCFAGKGKFDDGESGSPILFAELIKRSIEKQPSAAGWLSAICIEKKYHTELAQNLSGYPCITVQSGTFEDNLSNILSLNRSTNLFLYVDPYGIKNLSLSLFSTIKDRQFASLEMLMNFNSAGFLREGCRLLKQEDSIDEEEFMDYEMDYDSDKNTLENMNAVAGGDYWQEILQQHFNGQLSFHQAEEQFVAEYGCRMKQLFRYVVNIPIKAKSTHMPKYRLIFGTNSEDGLILMADNMSRKWKESLEKERGSQPVLFEYEFPDLALQYGSNLNKDMVSCVSSRGAGVTFKKLIVEMIQRYGITFSESEYRQTIRQILEQKALRIKHNPPLTPGGKPRKGIEYNDILHI